MTRSKTGILLVGFVIIFSAFVTASVSAADVAYILEDSSQVDTSIVSVLNDLGLSYSIIHDSQIPSTNFSNYYILLVTEDVGNKDKLPFNSTHAIFFDRRIAETVWDGSASSFTTNAKQIKIVIAGHQIFTNLTIPPTGIIDIYSGTGREIHYLSRKPSYVTSLAIKTTENKPVIASSVRTIDGYPVRDIFFGIIDSGYWNDNVKTMFKNSLVFLRADVDQDEDGYVFENDCNDNNASIYPGASEIPYDGVDQDCDGYDLLDQDNDGFCRSGYIIQSTLFQCSNEPSLIGTDCNDQDPVINPDYPDASLNCVNDAPEFTEVPQSLRFNEGDLIVFQVSATDPEGDNLIYSINNPHFTVNGNTFIWQTGYSDAGTYLLKINVTDGEYTTETTTSLNIINMNAPPISTTIPNQTWQEDTTKSLNLSEYFTDQDSQIRGFGIENYPDESKISVVFETPEIVVLTPAEDFFGEEKITFFAEDGISKTLSNEVTLKVTNVNDPVIFTGTIPNVTLNEDQPLLNSINLTDYFVDSDSVLNYTTLGNENITILFEGNKASFYPNKDFSGVETIYFNATDGEFSARSNALTITVNEMGEPPEFLPLNCSTTINEDTEHTCALFASDPENDTYYFSVSNQTNMVCRIEGNNLFYKSAQDYNGQASCMLSVSDHVDGYSYTELNVTILPVNDAPRITLASPTTDVVRLVEGQNRTFSVTATDIDSSSFLTNWLFQSQSVLNSTQNSSSYTLINPQIGNYLIEAIVRDAELQTTRNWNVVVGPIGDFTCSEVGGHVCSDGKTCGVNVLGVKDTDACCPQECLPSFKDAGSCKPLSNNVLITIDSFDSDIKLGDKLRVDFTLRNELDETQDFDITAYLYDLDADRSEASADTTTELNSGRSRSMSLDLTIPKDINLEDDNFVILVKAKDKECGQEYRAINIERPKNDISISDFDLPQNALCGETIEAEVTLENMGSQDQQVDLTMKSQDLKLDKSAYLELDDYSTDDNEDSRKFSFDLPNNIDSGEYEIVVRADYAEDDYETLTKKIKIECAKEQVQASTTVPNTIQSGKVVLNQYREIDPLPVKKPSYLPLAIIGTMNILLIGSAVVLYLSYKKSSSAQTK